MFDESFEGSLKDNCFDVLFAANRSVTQIELERLFAELVALRELSARANVSNEEINNFIFNNNGQMEQGLSDLYIELTSSILSQNE